MLPGCYEPNISAASVNSGVAPEAGRSGRLCPTLLTCKFSQIVEFIDHAECCPSASWVKLISIQCEEYRPDGPNALFIYFFFFHRARGFC